VHASKHKNGRANAYPLLIPLIRTLTVGLRVSLSQPIPGWHRVADYNRRFEITSTPETTRQCYCGIENFASWREKNFYF